MSEYLVQRIRAAGNVVVHEQAEIEALDGGQHLEAIRMQSSGTGQATQLPCAAVFVFIGAEPRTSWLAGQLAEDSHGFLLTGTGVPVSGPGGQTTTPLFLETSRPGIFAVGDVRSGSVKRAAAAIGEGSMAVRLVFDRLQSTGSADPIELGTSLPGA